MKVSVTVGVGGGVIVTVLVSEGETLTDTVSVSDVVRVWDRDRLPVRVIVSVRDVDNV